MKNFYKYVKSIKTRTDNNNNIHTKKFKKNQLRIEEEIEKVIAIFKLKYIATASACPIAIQKNNLNNLILLYLYY